MFEIYYDLGKAMLLDDIKDIGRYNFEGHPSYIHHWQIGLWIMIMASIGDYVSSIYDLQNLFNNKGDQNGKTPNDTAGKNTK